MVGAPGDRQGVDGASPLQDRPALLRIGPDAGIEHPATRPRCRAAASSRRRSGSDAPHGAPPAPSLACSRSASSAIFALSAASILRLDFLIIVSVTATETAPFQLAPGPISGVDFSGPGGVAGKAGRMNWISNEADYPVQDRPPANRNGTAYGDQDLVRLHLKEPCLVCRCERYRNSGAANSDKEDSLLATLFRPTV
jgi:hypothetical protein